MRETRVNPRSSVCVRARGRGVAPPRRARDASFFKPSNGNLAVDRGSARTSASSFPFFSAGRGVPRQSTTHDARALDDETRRVRSALHVKR
eukprot:31316-Pelagococcus_subviridis.AAC.7